MKPSSFFDDENAGKQKSIWNYQSNTDKKKIQPFLNQEFYKKTKTSGCSKKITLYLDSEFLYYSKDDKNKKITGLLDIRYAKIEFVENAEPEITNIGIQKKLFGFRLSRNQRGLDIFTEDESIYKLWKKNLYLRMIQTTFHEEFIAIKMIGKGSFAKVYLASKKENKIQYAVKAFNKEFMRKQHKGKESIMNEITIMRSLSNDHILHLYEVYETTNSIYFVLDMLDGGDLLHKIKVKSNILEGDIQVLMRNLLQALDHIHSKGIMHRDLKPENLLLKSKKTDYDIVIADFGLSAFVSDLNILFKRCGTPGFVAPEVLSYKENQPLYNQSCDIFSAGVIFYMLLTGRQPFHGKDFKSTLKANQSCEINYNIPELKKVSESGIDLLKRMLSPNPAGRVSAKQCLAHPFLFDEELGQNTLMIQENLKYYETEQVQNVKNKLNNSDSQEQLGSLAFHTPGIPALNGKTDTIESFSACSNTSIRNLQSKGQKQIQQSKFASVSRDQSPNFDYQQEPLLQESDLIEGSILKNIKENQEKQDQSQSKEDQKSDSKYDITEVDIDENAQISLKQQNLVEICIKHPSSSIQQKLSSKIQQNSTKNQQSKKQG